MGTTRVGTAGHGDRGELNIARTSRTLRFLPLVLALVGTLASFGTWRLLADLEDRYVASRFELDADERRTALEEEVRDALDVVAFMAAWREVQPESSDAFRTFAAPILARRPSIQALGWNPVVTAAERDAYEARQRARGMPDYRITERETQGHMRPAGSRDEYVVVQFIEPREGNEAALGFDVASEDRRREALLRARDTGQTTSTAAITLVQEREGTVPGFLVFHPAWRGDAHPTTVEERRASLEGYLVGVLRVGDLVAMALRGFDPVGIEIRLRDDDAPPGEQRLHTFGPQETAPELDHGFVREAQIVCGGRQWSLEFVPSVAYLAGFRTNQPLVALLAGLLLTALFTSYWTVLRRRAERITSLVSQRERAEIALSDSEELHRLTLESITDGGWDWDLVTGEVLLSDNWLANIRPDPDDRPPQAHFESVVHPDDAGVARAALDAHLAGNTPIFEIETRLQSTPGEDRWIRRRGKVVQRDRDGRPLRMVGTDTDVTELREAEEEQEALERRIREAQKLESLGVLAGGIAHDFNNLLQVVLGNLELAELRLRKGEPVDEELTRIGDATTRAADLVRQMLAYAGKGHTQREPVNLSALLADMVDLLRSSVSKKAELRFHLGDLALVDGDPSQLRQVFMNLLLNASDALGDEPGVVEVRADDVLADRRRLDEMLLGTELAPGPYILLRVEDDGCGMDAATSARVFEPFFSTKFQGRGLGLAATMGIVRSHGGALRVESSLGSGTTVEILLPAAPLPTVASAEARPVDSIRANGGGTVLVADDEASVRQLTRGMLEREGFHVLTAADGAAAVELFARHAGDLDVVVLDLTMPRLGGREAFREMARLRPEIPVILASAYGRETAIADLVGVADFIQKPYQAAALVQMIRSVLAANASDAAVP